MLYQYSEYLKEQMQKEAEDEAEYDAIRKKAEMRIWDERDAQLKARNDAREALMKEVGWWCMSYDYSKRSRNGWSVKQGASYKGSRDTTRVSLSVKAFLPASGAPRSAGADAAESPSRTGAARRRHSASPT